MEADTKKYIDEKFEWLGQLLQEHFTAIDSRLDRIDDRLAALEERITALEAKFAGLNRRIDAEVLRGTDSGSDFNARLAKLEKITGVV